MSLQTLKQTGSPGKYRKDLRAGNYCFTLSDNWNLMLMFLATQDYRLIILLMAYGMWHMTSFHMKLRLSLFHQKNPQRFRTFKWTKRNNDSLLIIYACVIPNWHPRGLKEIALFLRRTAKVRMWKLYLKLKGH